MDNFVICGDLNARCGDLQETSELYDIPKRNPVDTVTNQVGKELISTLETLDMCMLNGRFSPSWDSYTSVSTNGMSVVDYMLVPTKCFSSFKNFKVHDPLSITDEGRIAIDSSIPDHRILTTELDSETLRYNSKPPMTKKVTIKKIPADFMSSTRPVRELDVLASQLELDDSASNLDEVYDGFCKIIDSQLLTKQVSKGRSSNYSKPWWNKDLGDLAKDVRLALKQWEENKSSVELKLAYLNKQKQFSKLVRSSKRRFMGMRRDKLLDDQKQNPKAFWNFIKNIGGVQTSLPDSVKDEKGNDCSHPLEVKEVWMKYFQSLLNPPSSPSHLGTTIEPISNSGNLDPTDLDEQISLQEAEAAIFSNNNHKSPGVDGIRPMFIKNQACVKFIHTLCNYCFEHGKVPDAWVKAIIKPIPKTSTASILPTEYRGISLQSFVAKTYCRILNSRLRDYLEASGALCDEQNGFRPDRNCQDHIFTLTTIIENRLIDKKDTFACFVDFKKAFDCVNRNLLWHKIESRFRISGKFLSALKSLYSNVSCSVDINQSLSEWFHVDSGVKQGCILSPTLFAMFIDDLMEEIKGAQVGVQCGGDMVSGLLYADDAVVIAPDEWGLQKLIDVIDTWCKRWGMSLNINKTKVVHFRKKVRGGARSMTKFTLGREEIAYADQYKYLGLVLSEHLNWDLAFQEIGKKANRALALLNHRARMCRGLHTNTYTMLFNQLVQPIIMCNAGIWGHTENKSILGIQYSAMRFLLGVGKVCPIAGLFGETGWVPLTMAIKFQILRLRDRIRRMDGSRLTKKVHVWSESISGRTAKNWTGKTKALLESIKDHCGLMSCDEQWDALAKLEAKKWKEVVDCTPNNSETGGRFLYYRQIKVNPSAEQYILNSTSWNKRRIIAQLRCGCLPLEVELGRYRSPKTPMLERTCHLCDQEVGDESHFLLSCQEISTPRIELTEAMKKVIPNFLSLPLKEKTCQILQACATNPEVGTAVCHMYRERCNQLR